MRVLATSGLLLTVVAAGHAQAPAAAPIDWSADDSARIAFLTAHGRSYVVPPVIVWAPIDSLAPGWLASFSDSLAVAVGRLRALIGGPFRWQRLAGRPVRVYLSPGRFISHADGRDGVFISLERVRRRDGPFLHEAAHELLVPAPPFYPFEYPDSLIGEQAAAAFPHWLSEGLPDYLAQETAAATGFSEGDVFAIGGLAKVDSVCAARLGRSARRDEIRDRVGRTGRLEALFTTDRAQVAPVYYACSQSFTKYLVARLGLPAMVALFPLIPAGTWQVALESAAGQPLEGLRRGWLAALGLVPGTNLPDQGISFAYAGVTLESDFEAIAARYPHSIPQESYVRLGPEDIHDHISGIEVSGTGVRRRVRITFEIQEGNQEPRYPQCGEIEAKLTSIFGGPREVRRFSEEASLRADRIWRTETEVLTLLCFRGAGKAFWAEAVQITRRQPASQ